ncbi:MAG: hypothetical protein QXP98_01755 [Thermoproteus sp.]
MSPKGLLRLAYIFGALAALTALYLILNPYSTSIYYTGPVRPMNISVGGTLLLIYLNNTSVAPVEVPLSIGESIYGVNFLNNVSLAVGPQAAAVYNFSFANYVYINKSIENVYIVIKSIKIPLLNKILTIIMVILFLLMLAFLIVGYLFQIAYKTRRTPLRTNEEMLNTSKDYRS